MRRWIAVLWHASFFVIAAALYFFFVLPRWFELTGAWPVGLGQAMRIVCGALIGLAALPVVFTLLKTPQAGVRHSPARALAAVLVDRPARAGGCAHRRCSHQRDLGQSGLRRSDAIRLLRSRGGRRDSRRVGLLPRLRRRTAATAAETPSPQGPHPTSGTWVRRRRGRRGSRGVDRRRRRRQPPKPNLRTRSRKRLRQPRSRTPCKLPRHMRRLRWTGPKRSPPTALVTPRNPMPMKRIASCATGVRTASRRHGSSGGPAAEWPSTTDVVGPGASYRPRCQRRNCG